MESTMSRIPRLLSTILLIASACKTEPTSSEETAFKKQWATSWCERQKECAAGDYTTMWQDDAECIEKKSEDADFNAYWGDLLCGEFNQSAGNSCIAAMNNLACDDWTTEDWRSECELTYGC